MARTIVDASVRVINAGYDLFKAAVDITVQVIRGLIDLSVRVVRGLAQVSVAVITGIVDAIGAVIDRNNRSVRTRRRNDSRERDVACPADGHPALG